MRTKIFFCLIFINIIVVEGKTQTQNNDESIYNLLQDKELLMDLILDNDLSCYTFSDTLNIAIRDLIINDTIYKLASRNDNSSIYVNIYSDTNQNFVDEISNYEKRKTLNYLYCYSFTAKKYYIISINKINSNYKKLLYFTKNGNSYRFIKQKTIHS